MEYEYEMRAILQLLKYLHRYKPERFNDVRKQLAGGNIEEAEIFWHMWEIFDYAEDCYDEAEDISCIMFGDRVFDEYLRLSGSLKEMCGGSMTSARKKLEGVFMFWLYNRASSLYDVEFDFSVNSVDIKFYFNPEYYEPYELLCAMLDTLRYFRLVNEELRCQIEHENNKISSLPAAELMEAA